jgi:ribosomal protein S18 acetylase RimI-like enzyme
MSPSTSPGTGFDELGVNEQVVPRFLRRHRAMLTILPATSEQAARILAIQKRAFEREARLCDDWEIPPMTETLEAVLEHIVSATVLTAWIGPQLVGAARGILSGGVCTIRGVCVEPGYQGRRIGKMLLAALEQAHPTASRFELMTNAAMTGNVLFYERLGYRITGTEPYSDRIVLACMSKAAAVEDA